MSRSLILLILIWIEKLPLVQTIGCTPSVNGTSWLTQTQNTSITVEWAYGDVTCSSTHECFGDTNSPDEDLVPQIFPLQTQAGVTLRFQPNRHMGISVVMLPFKVTEEGFRTCNTSLGVPITSNATDDVIIVDDKYLSAGSNFFIVEEQDNAFLKCEFGLRINVTIKIANCAKHSLNSEMCGENGNCMTMFQQAEYNCQCCQGYRGKYCDVIDPCGKTPCQNGGGCIYDPNTPVGYHCTCPIGFNGDTCGNYIDDLCSQITCENNSTCSGDHLTFNCTCQPGYVGERCEINIDDCVGNPCTNGICVDEVNNYQCFCLPGFYGENCEHEYDECLQEPCKNGGTCLDFIDRFECRCDRGYTGEICSVKIDLCLPNPCRNASCSDLGNTYECHCHGGYTGPHCEENINECSPNPCHHGGTCRDLINGYECYCTEAHAGRNCEYSLDLFSPPLDSTAMKGRNHLHNLYLVAGTLSGAILIVIIVVAGCYCRMHETYKHLSWKQIRYRRQRDDMAGSCLDVSSVSKSRPTIDAIWEATSINYSDDLLTSPVHDSLKPKTV